jgi:hypothetical protein
LLNAHGHSVIELSGRRWARSDAGSLVHLGATLEVRVVTVVLQGMLSRAV